jgi:hypothetical protein
MERLAVLATTAKYKAAARAETLRPQIEFASFESDTIKRYDLVPI